MPAEGMGEEEQLAIALKASVDIALEEQPTRVASFIYDRAPGNLIVFSLTNLLHKGILI